MAKKDLLHAWEPEQKKEIGSTCTPERNQDQQLHLTELKQQIQAILGSVDQVKAAYRGTSHERPTRSSYFTPGTKQWSFFPQKNLLREERSTLRKGASGESIKSLLIRGRDRNVSNSVLHTWEMKAEFVRILLHVQSFLAVSPEIFIINATFILLIHGVVFSTSKKFDYPPLEDPWFWKAHEFECYVECATDTRLEELEGIGFNPATGSPYGYPVVNERPDLYSSSNLLLMIKKKEEKELGVGAYITACLLTKPSWQAPPVRL
nr:NADH dehydrogenase subunit 2, mitochondrial [Tanacetum cinerariifolium]